MVLVLLSTMILLVIIRYIQNVARSTFCDCFLSKYKQSSGKILLAVADCTHIKRKRSQRIDRATFCTEWKFAIRLRRPIHLKLVNFPYAPK